MGSSGSTQAKPSRKMIAMTFAATRITKTHTTIEDSVSAPLLLGASNAHRCEDAQHRDEEDHDVEGDQRPV